MTLLHLKYDCHVVCHTRRQWIEEQKACKDGEDKVIEAILWYSGLSLKQAEYIQDITEHGQEIILLKGGRGIGKLALPYSNPSGATFCNNREKPMQELMVILELKLLADVGLRFPEGTQEIHFFINCRTWRHRPKIANYPFTTSRLGQYRVLYRQGKSFVMADIPRTIEGASEGKGLGLRFLRHRTQLFVAFCGTGDTDDIRKEYEPAE